MLPEQRKRTRMTSRPVYHVIQEKRTQFRRERRLLVPAYRLIETLHRTDCPVDLPCGQHLFDHLKRRLALGLGDVQADVTDRIAIMPERSGHLGIIEPTGNLGCFQMRADEFRFDGRVKCRQCDQIVGHGVTHPEFATEVTGKPDRGITRCVSVRQRI